ncbi:SIMPL domain-containing protein [Xylanimonas sp. McL0601]|uniref:SIMPL domain-containing protein n=1 Tax=Xylanimonas sp. McL0601 TaxID=3414739 RepID=UPI003CE942A2
MARIAVHGSATRTVAPERGTVHLSVTVSGDSRSGVLADAQRTHAAVTTLAQRYVDEGAATRWTSPDVHAWAYTDWIPLPVERGGGPGQQEQVTRYRAGADVQVTFARLDALGELIGSLASLDDVDVVRLDWDLTDGTRAALLREVRTEASRDALARARDYAAALDLGEARLVGLYEDGLHPGVPRPEGSHGGPAARMLAKASAAEAGGFDLRPRDIEVTAEVTAELDAAGG